MSEGLDREGGEGCAVRDVRGALGDRRMHATETSFGSQDGKQAAGAEGIDGSSLASKQAGLISSGDKSRHPLSSSPYRVGRPAVRKVLIIRIWVVPRPAWAVGSYSRGPIARELPKFSSSKPSER